MIPSVACRTLLAKEQARIRQQYEDRLRDLERERQSVEEDKAQVGSADWPLFAFSVHGLAALRQARGWSLLRLHVAIARMVLRAVPLQAEHI